MRSEPFALVNMSLYESSLLLSIDAENGDIEQAAFQHGKIYTSLCTVCNNGYILVRMSSRKILRPVTKQLRWFEATAGGIVAISLHPSAEWLACLCFNGDIQLLPIVTLVLGEKPSQSLGSYTDVSTLKQRKSATTCFCWWVDSNDNTYLITGTENGEVFFYDAMKRCEVGNCRVKGYVGSLQILHIPDQQITYLLIGIRMNYYWSVLLEQCSCMTDVNVPEDQLAGFEIIRNVVESFITNVGDVEKYDPQLQAASFETVKLMPYKGYTMALYLRSDKLTQYQNILNNELHSHRMIPGTLQVVVSDKVFFTAGYEGDKACVHVISRQGSMVKQPEHQEADEKMILGQFIQEGALVSIFPESESDTDELGSCVLVTSKHVMLIKQSMTIEQLFQQMLLKKLHSEAEHLAKLVGASVQELYKVAAENCLINNDVDHALQYCLYSKCPSLVAMEMFAHHNKIEEITRYILKLFASEEQKTLHDPKKLADILIKCFIHQRLVHNKDTALQQQFSTFVNDNFLYQVPVAMEMLAKYHMREELITVGKSKGRLLDVMNMLCDHGDDLKVDTSIAVSQFASTFSQSNNRLFLHHMTNNAFVTSLTVKPNLIPHYISQLLVILPQLNEESLLQLATILDPSQPTIQPLLLRAVSKKRSDSTGSQSSVASDVPDEPYPSLDQFIELFLLTLLTLYQKRQSNSESRHVAKKKLATQQIQQCTLACGISHCALVSNSQLYTWGSTKNGKLGHNDYDDNSTSTPLMVDTFNLLSIQVLSVSCGAEHTLALCKEGVYSWGSSSHGQLGLGDMLTRNRPVQVASLADKIIVAVSCGQYHSLALSDDYRTFVWGWGVHGQLGLGATDDHVIPTHLSLSQHVISISAGYCHTCLLTIKGHVLTCGSSHYGQLGHGTQDKQSTPLKVSTIADKKVVKIACGIFHTVAVTSDNFVYFWGKQAYSQPDSFQQYRRMRQLSHVLQPMVCDKTGLEGGVAEVRCGSAHSLLLTATGQVYVWGSNSRGQLGMSHISEVSAPRKLVSLAGVTIVSIAAGDDYCVAVDDTGKVWGWGICDQAQLGSNNSSSDKLTKSSDGKLCSFSPLTIMETSGFTEQTDSVSLLGWDLPNLSSIDSSGDPYGSEVLDICLTRLKDYYHTSTILRYCRQWELWDIMARIYAITCQYPQAMECMLKHSSSDNVNQVLTTLDEYLRSLNSTEKVSENHSSAGIDLLLPVIKWFEKYNQPITLLENKLTLYLDTFADSLSSLLQRGDVSFSTGFQLKVMGNVLKNLPTSTAMPSETASHTSLEDNDRLWSEVMRNLATGKTTGISTNETNLHFLREASNRRTYFWSQQLPADGLVLFTCGHSFTRIQFQCIVDEFEEHLQELPVAPPAFIVEHYRGNESPLLTLGCPYCVFSMLRKQQLQQFPDVPIRAWSPH